MKISPAYLAGDDINPECCLHYLKKEEAYGQYEDCEKSNAFLCQKNTKQTPQPYCSLCSTTTQKHYWFDSVCKVPDTNFTATDLQDNYWQSQTTCRCGNTANELRYGFDCEDTGWICVDF